MREEEGEKGASDKSFWKVQVIDHNNTVIYDRTYNSLEEAREAKEAVISENAAENYRVSIVKSSAKLLTE